MPIGLGFEEAAAIPQAGVMAAQALRGKRNIHPGDRVLVNGAGGNIGPFAVQIAKSFGAEVTAVDTTDKLAMLTAIGADYVVDFTKDDYTKAGPAYDWIVDVASYRSILKSMKALTPEGVYVMVPATMSGVFQAFVVGPILSIFSKQKLGMLMWRPFNLHDIAFLTELVESDKLRPVIDRRVSFEELQDALNYQMEGLPAGKVVISVASAR